MRLPVMVYLVWPWEPEHRIHDAPVQISIHTRTLFLSIRPFSAFAQGGDRRGENAWRARKGDGGAVPEPASPWEREHAAKWVLQDENPQIWSRLDYRPVDFLLRRGLYARCRHSNHRTRRRTCIWSVAFDEVCFLHYCCARRPDSPCRADAANGAGTP